MRLSEAVIVLAPRYRAFVPALLAPQYAETCLWQQQATFPTVHAADLPTDVDVVVVGAGY